MDKDKKEMWKKAFRAAFPQTIPVLTGFAFLGIAYGVLMNTKGYGVLWSFLMSAVAFCGSMQFVAITLLTIPFNPLQAFLMSLMVNARHLFYGISMLKKYRGLGKIKGFLIYTMCDETFSIACSAEVPEGVDRKSFYFFISLLDYLYWIGGSVIGGLLGGLVSFDTKGLDFVLTALFVVIFLNQWENRKNRLPAAIGVGISALCVILFGADQFIIPAMIGLLVCLTLLRKPLEKAEVSEETELSA
ncbi:AzlC family ABC transporter permease [Anaerolentibacter hominis]|uniref:AzlC family ABC transporter permease n=1 Tax=Anaerolentibacter hominis TaxID=3079009 RepID=UPI0031B8A657